MTCCNLDSSRFQTVKDQLPAEPLATRESLLQNARTWAHKALDVAAAIVPPARTEECDVGCVVALHNLGEFAQMAKDLPEARKRYNGALSLARALNYEEGIENTSAQLRALDKKS